MTAMPPKPFTVMSLAERWGCSDQHIRDMISRRELACFRIGRLIRIPVAEVDRIETHHGDPKPDETAPATREFIILNVPSRAR